MAGAHGLYPGLAIATSPLPNGIASGHQLTLADPTALAQARLGLTPFSAHQGQINTAAPSATSRVDSILTSTNSLPSSVHSITAIPGADIKQDLATSGWVLPN